MIKLFYVGENESVPGAHVPSSEVLKAINSSVSSLSTDVVKFSRAVSSSSTSSSSKWSAAWNKSVHNLHTLRSMKMDLF